MSDSYQYKVRDKSGNLVTGTLVADNERLVLERLREMGYTPLEVGKEKKGLNLEINIKPAKIKLKEVAIFSRQFATMVNSGLPILRALSILSEQVSNKELAKTLVAVRNDVEQGASLSGAMAKFPKAFNDLYIAMVKSGETGGMLDDVLLRLADVLEREVHLRQKIKSAMTYPVAVVALVVLIMSAMLLFVVPQFKSHLHAAGRHVAAAHAGAAHGLGRGEEVLVRVHLRHLRDGVPLQALQEDREGPGEPGRDQAEDPDLRHALPQDRAVPLLQHGRMLLRSGVPILQALDIVADTVNNAVMSRAVVDVQASVREGESIAKPLARHAVFPPMVVQMLAVGEETGQVDTMLDKVAKFYDQEVEAAVDALTSLIEPLLIAIIGGAVGAAVIALYMPMFNIIKLIQ